MKTKFKSIFAFGLALMMIVSSLYFGVGAINIYAENESLPTIQMGDNAPMTRDEFMDWREQRDIRHFSIEGRVMPAGAFFDWYSGNVFRYGELKDMVLYVYLVPNASSNNRIPSDAPTVEAPVIGIPPTPNDTSPVIFYDLTPIFFSDDELTAMIESVPLEWSMDIRSSITLPNRSLTESELEAWINEYNEMGGATAFELGVIREVNRVRERYGLHPLALSPALMMSSRLKAQEFADLQYYNHNSPVHGMPWQAATRLFGVEGFVGENMAKSGNSGVPRFVSTPERVVGGMLASDRGHRELLLHPNLYSVGFGTVFSPNSTGAGGNMSHMFYYVTQFEYMRS